MIILLLLCWVGLAVAGAPGGPPRPDRVIMPPQTYAPRAYDSGRLDVPEGAKMVWVILDRTKFMNQNARVRVTIEAQVGGQWFVIKRTGQTRGGAIVRPDKSPQTESVTFVSLPTGTDLVRTTVEVSQSAGTFGVVVRFTP